MAGRPPYTRTTVRRTSYQPEPEPPEPGSEIYQPPSEYEEQTAPEIPPVVTVGEEQLARSREMEAMGVENWKAANDQRSPEDQPQSVQGVER